MDGLAEQVIDEKYTVTRIPSAYVQAIYGYDRSRRDYSNGIHQ
jgi:hypothetical protein